MVPFGPQTARALDRYLHAPRGHRLAGRADPVPVAVGVDVAHSGPQSTVQELAVPGFLLLMLDLAIGVLGPARREREPAVA